MKETLRQRLDSFTERFEELAMLLSDPDVINNQQRFRDYSREYAELEELVAAWQRYRDIETNMDEAEQLSRDSDADMRELAEMELSEGRERLAELDIELKRLLVPKDPDDGRGVFLEVRAGTGGDEAAILRATCSACTPATPKNAVGGSRSLVPATASRAATKRSSLG
ncbi:hypothetical protein HSBAA_45630 [Vreelandella sulfidaeris]|uniref:Peptide chain release factor domain-containing protein n=1 Tax=Vreelandella sulfidaeris TaxID=115553 RepID=A0A455UCB7_9GAMM|nr:hypothetical protein HSBAA_45630 [Halomonas sulfidaeris]